MYYILAPRLYCFIRRYYHIIHVSFCSWGEIFLVFNTLAWYSHVVRPSNMPRHGHDPRVDRALGKSI